MMAMESSNNLQITLDDQKEPQQVGSTTNNFETFFRHCPSCGKRFEIKLVGKTLIESEDIRSSRPISAAYFGGSMGSFMEVGETEPVFVDIETFRYAYKCKHCGHKWVEIKKEDY